MENFDTLLDAWEQDYDKQWQECLIELQEKLNISKSAADLLLDKCVEAYAFYPFKDQHEIRLRHINHKLASQAYDIIDRYDTLVHFI